MSAKLVMVGAIVTLVTVIAAAVSVINQPGLTKAEVSGEPAFSALRQSPDAVARVTIAGKDGEFSVARNDAGLWVIPEKHGYPVAFAKVRELVATMAGMDLIEGMTANPDRFARLEVEDLDKEAAESRRVRLETADGSVLAETIVGKRRHGFTGGRETGTYIRRDGDERAWLASGGLVVNVKPEEWLDRGVVDISADSIQTMTFDPLEGKGYTAAREQAGADLVLSSVPQGRTAKEAEVSRLASVLSSLEFEDVQRAMDVELPDAVDLLRARTFDGLEVTMKTAVVDGGTWAMVSAEAKVEDADATDETNAVREIAKAINDRVNGWVYKFPAYVTARFNKSLDSLLEAEGAEGKPRPDATIPAPGGRSLNGG